MPSLPMRMVPLDPSRIVRVPPIAMVPMMMFIPVAVGVAPLAMMFGPLRMVAPRSAASNAAVRSGICHYSLKAVQSRATATAA
jgi:hypothetical protein